jgi:hypothetical protein
MRSLAVLGLGLVALASAACTNVRYSRRNPQTGETWTVYSHTFEDDTVSYCAPSQWGGACRVARRVSSPPQVMPSQAYAPPPGPSWVVPVPPMQSGWQR